MLPRFALSSFRRAAPSWRPAGPAASFSPSWLPAAAMGAMTSSPPMHHQPPPQTPHQTTPTRHRSSRSTRGLYDGKDVGFGNNVPFSMKKTRRRWNPNVQKKRIYSEVLDEMVKFHVTTNALRTIDKMGGLDNYLLKSKHVSTKGKGEGQRTRNRIVQKMKHREKLRQEAVARGESVEEWDRIVLQGKKIKTAEEEA